MYDKEQVCDSCQVWSILMLDGSTNQHDKINL